jgi:homoserine kinase type II
MDEFPVSNQESLITFLSQYALSEPCQANTPNISATYTARSHHTCRFYLSDSDTSADNAYLLLVVEPEALDRLTFTASLIEHHINKNSPVTPCLKNKLGQYISLFDHCPALLFSLPDGQPPINKNSSICTQIGSLLGKIHANSSDFSATYGNPRSLVWLNLSADELLPELSTGDASLLKEQLDRFKSTVDAKPNLPNGPLIGSLFKDQLYFQGEKLTAVTGFYFSCTDWLLLDVAQAVNEWCCNEHGELDKHLTKALLSAYHAERPFTPCEGQYWQDILCFSATRFWVSRLLTSLIPDRAGCPSVQHNPGEYKEKLRRRITGYCPLPCDKPD